MDRDNFRFSPRANRADQIDWLVWGEDVFRRSRDEKKPILLSVSAVWCHWCHVMDETSYSDDRVITLINEKFIPVRVDSDRRPDINSRYNQGGWPSTAFLTPDGEIIAGTTYVPPEDMSRLLNDVAEVYSRSAAEIDAAVELVRQRRCAAPLKVGGGLDQSIVDYVADLAEKAFDAEHGGFGTEPKFLYPNVLGLLLTRLAADAPGDAGTILRTTLARMAAGGIYDQVEGGFFRYSTTQDWSVPHFEKLLEDNAAMMAVFAEAYNLSADADYAKVVYGIQGFLGSTLRDPATGAFGGSQDADEEYYGLAGGEREQRQAPLVDETVFSGANAQAASALLRAYQVLGDEELRAEALGALDFVWENLWQEENGQIGRAHV